MNSFILCCKHLFIYSVSQHSYQWVLYVYISLVNTLIAVACTQFHKLTTAILDNRQQHFIPHYVQEDEQDHTIANCELQGKLNECIRHHQDIIG